MSWHIRHAFFSSVYDWHLERGQPKLVSTVLDAEDAQKEAVHAKQNATPDEHSNLLCTRVGDPGNFECKGDRGEREDTICIPVSLTFNKSS
jgi:hypothetical protein